MNGHGIEQDMTDPMLDAEWGAWIEATYDPDHPPYDTLNEENGHA